MTVEEIKQFLPAAKVFRVLAHPHRIKIIEILLERDEIFVGETALLLNLHIVQASQHLDYLRKIGVLNKRKVVQVTYYSLNKANLEFYYKYFKAE